MFNETEKSWETIHTETSNVIVQELQSCGLNFNVSSHNMDKIVTWLSSNKVTGLYRNKITNSKIQINMVHNLRVVVTHSQDNLWKLSGFKLLPKALINIEKNNKGVFSKIPVKHLRSCILDPEYFDLVNKEIVLALTDDQIDFNIRLRAIRTLNLIISLNQKMVPLIFNNLDLEKVMKLLYKQDSRGCRYIIGLFRKFYESESLSSQISTTVIENVANIHKIAMTYPSLEAFMNLISCQMVTKVDEIFKIIFETLYYKITKEAVAKLQTSEYTILRKYVDSNSFPFDAWNFNNQGDNVITRATSEVENKQVKKFEKQSTPLPYKATYINQPRVKEYIIDLQSQTLVREIRLLFSNTKSKSFRMNVKIYGQHGKKEILLFSNSYDDSTYAFLTQNSYLKEYGLYDESEEREALCVSHLNYLGRNLRIQVAFLDSFLTLNGQHSVVEDILPEIYGEVRSSDNSSHTSQQIVSDGAIASKNLTVGHSSLFKTFSFQDDPHLTLKCCPTEESSTFNEEVKIEQNETIIRETRKDIEQLQDKLKNVLWELNGQKKDQKKNQEKVSQLLADLEKLKSSIPQDLNLSDEIVGSLEYQMCLANKFSQLLISLYKANPQSLKNALKGYPLEQIVYELYVYYIIKGSQTSDKSNKTQNIYLNEIWLLINSVLLPAISNQDSIDKLVIKVLNDFILTSDPIYSKARVIESLENLPYSYDKVIAYAYDNLYQDEDKIIKGQSIESILESMKKTNVVFTEDQTNTNKLLMTVLALNNLEASNNKQGQTKISNTLQKGYKITEWITKNVTLSTKTKHFLLSMSLDLLVYLLKISSHRDYQELIKAEKFLTNLSVVIFMMDSKPHKKQLALIFDILINGDPLRTREEIVEQERDGISKYKFTMESKLIILENSFKFWQSMIELLLSNEHILKETNNKSSWIENLLYSLDFYLNSIEKLNNLIKHIEDNNDVLKVDEEYINISKLKPNFKVIRNLVELLTNIGSIKEEAPHKSVRMYSSSHLTTLWSLVFETVA